jgi:hypothetical protein
MCRWLTLNPTPTARFAADAVRALRRVIRVRRRLMKLAPELYDEAYREHLDGQQREEEARRIEVKALLDKVYGDGEATSPSPDERRGDGSSPEAGNQETENAPCENADRCKKSATFVQNSSPFDALRHPHRTPRQKQRIALCETERELAMSQLDESFARIQRRRFVPQISLSLICGLIDGAILLGRQVCGLETNFKPDKTFPSRNFEEDLKRAYGAVM